MSARRVAENALRVARKRGRPAARVSVAALAGVLAELDAARAALAAHEAAARDLVRQIGRGASRARHGAEAALEDVAA